VSGLAEEHLDAIDVGDRAAAQALAGQQCGADGADAVDSR
jgi:hypothetical protein